jgi:hypothetical protein
VRPAQEIFAVRSLFLFGLAAPALVGLAMAGAMSKGHANADAFEPALRTVRGGAPVELCVRADARAASGLAAGSQRPVLAVMSYHPPPEGPSGIEVTSSATGKTTRIGIFPGGPFEASGPADARRYYLPSVGGNRAATECFTVKLPAEGGAATVMLEISPPSAN